MGVYKSEWKNRSSASQPSKSEAQAAAVVFSRQEYVGPSQMNALGASGDSCSFIPDKVLRGDPQHDLNNLIERVVSSAHQVNNRTNPELL